MFYQINLWNYENDLVVSRSVFPLVIVENGPFEPVLDQVLSGNGDFEYLM